MLNLNALKLITGCTMSDTTQVVLANGKGSATLYHSENTVRQVFSGINIIRRTAYADLTDSGSTGLYFCSTAQSPTVNDYDFADKNAVLNLEGSGTAPAVEFFDDHADIFSALTVTNPNSQDAVISEIYYVKYYGNGAYLLDHTVLDSPITIPANGVRSLTYTIRINF